MEQRQHRNSWKPLDEPLDKPLDTAQVVGGRVSRSGTFDKSGIHRKQKSENKKLQDIKALTLRKFELTSSVQEEGTVMTERVQIRSLSFRQTEDAARRIHRRSFANKAFFMSKLLFGFLVIILLGALVFHAAESNKRKKEIEENIKKRKEVMQILGNNETLFNYIIDRMDGLHRGHEKNHWNLSGSFFFAFTVATTIGYGDYAPKTFWGRAFFCIYGVVAIPVAGIILVKFANQVLKFFTYLYTIRKDRARKAFKVLDQSGTGFLNRSQFRQSLEELSVDMTDDEYSKLLKKLLFHLEFHY